MRATTTARSVPSREDAASHGLKVMADLVINHTANDARLVAERPDVYDRDEKGGIRAPFAVDPDDPSIVTVWGDLAELSYREPSAREFLLGYWDGYVARLQALGIRGFRCDAAYKVPPDVWRHLIGRAKARDRGALFAAETLGCTFDETAATAGAGFDYLFNSFAWWDLRAPWALETYEALRVVAPSIAFPENHDMPRIARIAGGRSGAGRGAPQGALRARRFLLLRRPDADRLRVGLSTRAPCRRDLARAARGDRRRHLRLRRRRERDPGRASGRERRRRAVAALGAGRAVPRAAALRCRPPGGGAKRGADARQSDAGAGRDRPRPAAVPHRRLSRPIPGAHARRTRRPPAFGQTPGASLRTPCASSRPSAPPR